MTRRLESKVALVVGAGRGIGRAIALAFAVESARLALAARTPVQLEAVREACIDAGAEAIVVPTDVSRRGDAERLARTVEERLGGIDILVNAAGTYGPIGVSWEVDPREWMRTIEVNLFGTFALCRAAAGSMRERGAGKIVLLGGGGAATPLPRFSAYASSKAAIVRLAETLAVELSPHVQVNVIAPGLVDTSLQDEVLAAGENAGPLLAQIREARETGAGAVPPELAAELAVFLASAESGRLTGKLIAAPHDPWREWAGRGDELNSTPLYTVRRVDAFTVLPLAEALR